MIIKVFQKLDDRQKADVDNLALICAMKEHIAFKLELDWKMTSNKIGGVGVTIPYESAIEAFKVHKKETPKALDEFLCYDENMLVGYIGIVGFGDAPLEVNGMVHPQYRRQGIYTTLFRLVDLEWRTREAQGMLLLTDRKSDAGKAFILAQPGRFSHSEYEMVMKRTMNESIPQATISLRAATNADALEVAYQNSLYSCIDYDETSLVMPEEEAKRGMFIFIAEHQQKTIGKVNIIVEDNVGGIYGLGILPSFRGRGFGRLVLEKAVKRLQEMGVDYVKLQVDVSNEKALMLYTSTGFEVTSAMDYYAFNRPKFER